MMMGKEMEESSGEFWLPDDFLSDDFFVEKNGGGGGGDGSNLSSPESEAGDEYLAGLTQKMALSFLLQDGRNSGYLSHCYAKNSVIGTSPQSTLCGMGGWPYSGSGSPEGRSQVSSPPSSPFPPPQREIDALELYAAAGQVARMRLYEQEFHRRGGVLTHPKSIVQQQLQAARFYQLRRQQLLKQQWALHHHQAARARDEMGSLGLSNSAWPPLQKQPHNPQAAHREPAARPVLPNGNRRESKGTGVFLPRRAGTPTEPRTKPACSPVQLPARVVQALNLNLEDVTVNPSVPGTYLIDQETLIARGTAMQVQGNRVGVCPRPVHDPRLPREWTY